MANKVIFVPPVYEKFQHTATKVEQDSGRILQASLHSDVSLLLRIDKMHIAASEVDRLNASLQSIPDYANFAPELKEAMAAASDKELLASCPSRYIQTLSEKQSAVRAAYDEYNKQAEANDARVARQKASEEQSKQDDAFTKALDEYNKIMSKVNFH